MTENQTTRNEPDYIKVIEAMKKVGEALDNLGEEARERVLEWACKQFLSNKSNSSLQEVESPKVNMEDNCTKNINSSEDIEDLSTLFDKTSPANTSEQALVVGYWAQKTQGNKDFGSQIINTELKHLGYGVKNITMVLNSLIREKLVLQVRKSGTSKQGRRKYKLTDRGVKQVENMLNQDGE